MAPKTPHIPDLLDIIDTFPNILAQETYAFQRSPCLPVSYIQEDTHPRLLDVYQVVAYQTLAIQSDHFTLEDIIEKRATIAKDIVATTYQSNPIPHWAGTTPHQATNEQLNRLAHAYLDAIQPGLMTQFSHDDLRLDMTFVASLTALNMVEDLGDRASQDVLNTIVFNYEHFFCLYSGVKNPSKLHQAQKKATSAYRQIDRLY